MDIAALARRIKKAIDDADCAAISDEIGADPAARTILAELARVRDPEVRGFVPRAARLMLGREAVPLLKKLLEDRDPEPWPRKTHPPRGA